ncbi:MAG: D-hexose-6-phosphate mutarotase [Campylobacterota bacterium]|nr:D-hexose-6-phosphate mutarotase [Campylobacterota bacterium]
MIREKQLTNGFQYVEIENSYAYAKIALQGAHLFHYQVKEKTPLLWLSQAAYFEEGKAIRGGVPICFPWFGKKREDPTLPQHGFARTSLWRVILEEELDDESSHVRLELVSSKETLKLWNYTFKVTLDILVSNQLTMALTTTNTDTKPFELSCALHTYFAISHIEHVSIEGLEGKQYYNNLDGKSYRQEGKIVLKEEVDRVYFEPSKSVTLSDSQKKVTLRHEGSNSVVVWNPWLEKSQKMVDMLDGGYETMVCIESANAGEDARMLKPGERHTLKAMIV